MELKVITKPEDVKALEAEWLKLLHYPCNKGIHQNYDWFITSCKTFHQYDEFHVLIVLDHSGSIACVAPLVIMWRTYRRVRVRTIGFARNEQSPANDFIFSPGLEEISLRLVFEYLAAFKRWDLIELHLVNIEGMLGRFLQKFLVERDLAHGYKLNRQTPYILIDRGWDDFWASRSKKFRKAMRHKLNRAGKQDGLIIEKSPVTDGSAPALTEIISISRNSWKGRAGRDLSARDETINFYNMLCDMWGPRGLIHVWVLKIRQKAAAFEFHIQYMDTVYPIRADYDESYKEISPGSILEYEIIKDIFQGKRIMEYDSCGHTYKYLMNWTEQVKDYRNIEVFKKSPKLILLHNFEYRLLVLLRKFRFYCAMKKIFTFIYRGEGSKFISNALHALSEDFSALFARQYNFHKITPATSTLFLTYRCNSKCKTCTMWQRPHQEEIKKEIGLEQWKGIVDELAMAGIKSTELFGGNVLLRKDVLIELLKHIHDKGLEIHLPTNQIGLSFDVAEAIVKYVHRVYISIDGLDDGQDSIRGIKGASTMAEDSVDMLVRLKRSIKRKDQPLMIVCNCTISKFNCHLLDRMAEYAARKGFDEIHFEYAGEFEKSDIAKSKIGNLTPQPYYIRQGESILLSEKEAIKLKNDIEAVKKKYNQKAPRLSTINIDSLSLTNLWQGTIPHRKCYAERTEVTIDPYGNVVACPFINNYVLGNLLEMPFRSIWNNKNHRYFRNIQNTGGLPMCRHCILGVQRNPGIIKSLQRIYLSRIKPKLS